MSKEVMRQVLDKVKSTFWEGYVPEPVKPAQQEPKIDIYRSFEQWKRGNVLEHGVPRTEHYSEAQLDLVEMGWNYGYDAGRAVEQALDKKAENARELGLDYEPPLSEKEFLEAEIKRLEHNEEVLMNALFKACGDDAQVVEETIESQGELK